MKVVFTALHPINNEPIFQIQQNQNSSHAYHILDCTTQRYTGPVNPNYKIPTLSTKEAALDCINGQIAKIANATTDSTASRPWVSRTTYRSGQPTITPIDD